MSERAENEPGYVVLARKYRPQRFADVVGQSVAVQTLQNALRSGRLAHAFLFSGPRGVGKTSLARLLARALNCARGVTVEPCGECDSCVEVAEGRGLDVLEIDGASNNKVEEARQLRETVRYAPARDRFRVFIIDEVHMLSVAAFNALLKTLEEPPPHIKFVLATTEAHKIPATILSRCQHYEFRRLAVEEIQAQLAEVCRREGLPAEEDALRLIARSGGGSMRDALSALDQVAARAAGSISEPEARSVLGLIPQERVLGVFQAASKRDLPALLRIAHDLFQDGSDPARFCEEVLAQARDLLVERLSPEGEAGREWVGVAAEKERRALAKEFTPEQLVRLFTLFFDLEQKLRGASLPQALLEVVCVKLVHLADLTPIEDILRRLQEGGRAQAEPDGAGDAAAPGAAAAARPTAGAPPPAEPGAEPAAGDPHSLPPGGGGSDLRDQFLSRVRERRLSLGTFLENARGIEREGDVFVITFLDKHGFFHDQALDSLPLLKEAAVAMAGPGAGVRLARVAAEEAGGEAPGVASGELTEEARRGQLLDKVRREPIVQSAIEIFGAQILDVQEP